MKILYAISGAFLGLVIVWLFMFVVSEVYVAWHGDRTVMGAFTIPMMIFLPAGIFAGAKFGIELFEEKRK